MWTCLKIKKVKNYFILHRTFEKKIRQKTTQSKKKIYNLKTKNFLYDKGNEIQKETYLITLIL